MGTPTTRSAAAPSSWPGGSPAATSALPPGPKKSAPACAQKRGRQVACGPLAPDEKDEMIHELDAVIAHLYGLTENHLVHVFETFHEGWDYDARLRATLKHFRDWKREKE